MSFTLDTLSSAEAKRPFFITDEVTLSFGETRDRVLPRARRLVAAGRRPLLLEAELTLDTALWIVAAIWAGAPLLPLHPRLTPRERAQATERLACLRPHRLEELEVASLPEPELDPNPPEHPLAYVQTSGTSAAPKWVCLSHRAFEASANASASHLGWVDGDRWLLNLPLAHVAGLSIITRCWLGRRSVVLGSRPSTRDPTSFVQTLERHRVTLLSLVPTQLEPLLACSPPPSLRAVLLGGAAATGRLVHDALSKGWPVLPTYGLTEACSQVATAPYPPSPGTPVGATQPLPGVRVRIVDGCVEVGGRALFSGYLNGPTVTPEETFRTGDLGVMDAGGYLFVTGRADALIVTGGENVSPEAVEVVLRRQLGVHDAAVFGVPDPTWGQLVAAVVVIDGIDPARLMYMVRDELAPHARPRRIAVASELPRGHLGKLDRGALLARFGSELSPC